MQIIGTPLDSGQCLPITQKFRKFRMECKWKFFFLPKRKFLWENGISWKVVQNSQTEFPIVKYAFHLLLSPVPTVPGYSAQFQAFRVHSGKWNTPNLIWVPVRGFCLSFARIVNQTVSPCKSVVNNLGQPKRVLREIEGMKAKFRFRNSDFRAWRKLQILRHFRLFVWVFSGHGSWRLYSCAWMLSRQL